MSDSCIGPAASAGNSNGTSSGPDAGLCLHSPFAIYDGYGSVAEYLALGIARAGVPVRVQPLMFDGHGLSADLLELIASSSGTCGGCGVVFSIPPPNVSYFRQMHTSLVVNTMWEADRFPSSWIGPLNDVDAVVVPTRFVAEAASASGVKPPIHVVPEGIDPHVYRYVDRPSRSTFTTLIVGFDTQRKKSVLAIEAWKRAFRNVAEARLVFKARWQLGTYRPDDPRIRLIDMNRPTRGIADLYGEADVLVSIGNEGFGLPLVEGMATGLPVIALNSEGQRDICEDADGLVLTVDPVFWEPANDTFYGPGGSRGVPSADDVADRLRWVFDHRVEARAMGKAASAWAIANRNIWSKGRRIVEVAVSAGAPRDWLEGLETRDLMPSTPLTPAGRSVVEALAQRFPWRPPGHYYYYYHHYYYYYYYYHHYYYSGGRR
jgi:hypothetical protein